VPKSDPEQELPQETDLIILGSGVAGLTAALSASLSGLRCVVLEHSQKIGGTSAFSSGTVWVPDNSFMREAGMEDQSAAHRYIETLVGGRAPRNLWQRFLDIAPVMQANLADRAGITFRPFKAAADYRQDIDGAAPGWRALEPVAFDGRKLGPLFDRLAWPIPELMLFGKMMITRGEAALLLKADRSLSGAWLGIKLLTRYLRDRLFWKRGTRLVMGNALVARLLDAVSKNGVSVFCNVSVTRLVRDDGKITGVKLVGPGSVILATKGVVLAGGGFPSSEIWRARELPQPVAEFSPAAPGCVGKSIELGLDVGGVLGRSGVDNALWFPSSVMKRSDGSTAVYPHIVLDRAKPGSLIVNQSGQRFVNEAVSYHEFVRGMYRANNSDVAIPAWMICTRAFIAKYGLGLVRPRTPFLGKYVRSGYLIKAPTILALAEKLGIPSTRLDETVRRFNGFARQGRDDDFHRGETIYDRGNGDANHRPNPCLGPIENGPFYAVKLYPTPLGTSRGLRADIHARVLDQQSRPIEGLYVCGNDMQSPFGGEYPGAGAQLGPAMTFGWIAGQHAAGREV
tara:strand:- start:77324 stop:79027 length:1704 start_codon:yes stop_codon:yes gene_type:complete